MDTLRAFEIINDENKLMAEYIRIKELQHDYIAWVMVEEEKRQR